MAGGNEKIAGTAGESAGKGGVPGVLRGSNIRPSPCVSQRSHRLLEMQQSKLSSLPHSNDGRSLPAGLHRPREDRPQVPARGLHRALAATAGDDPSQGRVSVQVHPVPCFAFPVWKESPRLPPSGSHTDRMQRIWAAREKRNSSEES